MIPTEPGYYWVKQHPDFKWRMAEVGTQMVHICNGMGFWRESFIFAFPDAQWGQRLTPPAEGSEKP